MTRQQHMGQQSSISAWSDGKVLISKTGRHAHNHTNYIKLQ